MHNRMVVARFTPLHLGKRFFTNSWFYAVDVPKRKPFSPEYEPQSAPRKFKKFEKHDSDRLKVLYKKWKNNEAGHTVPVSEDGLYEVDFKEMELRPTYWNGPIYEVRKGKWYDSSSMPLPTDLADELDRLSMLENDDGQTKVVRKLNGGPFDVGKFVLFISDREAFILQNLEGGSLLFKYLKSGLGQYLSLNGYRVIKDEFKDQNILKQSNVNQDEVVEHRDESESTTVTAKPQKLTSLVNWEFFNSLRSYWDSSKNEKDIPTHQTKADPMESDYDDIDKSFDQSGKRQIKHLVLCVHGIGQTLGKKYEYVNFSHTVNLLRTNMKNLYSQSKKLQNINRENGETDWESNCTVQVLPISWRDSIEFSTSSRGKDISDHGFPTLSDINVNGILPLRKLLGDIAIDVLLYMEPYYKNQILNEVVSQLNETYELFRKHNKNFDGEVHLIGHSLGSVILFDILSNFNDSGLKFRPNKYFSIGSPIGLLKLVQRTRIGEQSCPKIQQSETIDIPACEDFYNVYHVCDPIAYRVEPLISPMMAKYRQVYIPHWDELSGITSKVLQMGGSLFDGIPSSDKANNLSSQNKLTDDLLNRLTKLNRTGRVDYSLPPNLLEVDMISAIRSHVSYFEEPDIAGFILQEIINKKERALEVKIVEL